jgi:hypothetical protein
MQRLKTPTLAAALAFSGAVAAPGVQGGLSNATGVNGDQANNLAQMSGAAYVFVRSGSTWSQQAYLKASNTEANDVFGLRHGDLRGHSGRWGSQRVEQRPLTGSLSYFTISRVPETGYHSLSLDAKPYKRPVSRFMATVSVYPDSAR